MAATPGHPRARTGIRLVLTNAADPSRANAYSAWYDEYERVIIRPGLLANAFRFEKLRASYALTGSLEIDHDHRALTGVHIILSDESTDTVRAQRAAALVETGVFYGASRFRIIEGTPMPPAWLEIFETDLKDPLAAYARAVAAVAPQPPAGEVRERSSHSFALVAAH
jgi:hypothetical protein